MDMQYCEYSHDFKVLLKKWEITKREWCHILEIERRKKNETENHNKIWERNNWKWERNREKIMKSYTIIFLVFDAVIYSLTNHTFN